MIIKSLISSALIVGLIGFGLYPFLQVPDIPELDQNRWWGPGNKPDQMDKSIRKFHIEFNDSMIKDLRDRVANRHPLTNPLKGINSEYGINTIYLEEVLEYWRNNYDFKKRAEMLNTFDHYKTKLQGLHIHFIWQKPNKNDSLKVLPIILMHGWPSSSKEFDKIIPILTTPREGYDFVFEVIAVDLPGFGFSEGTTKPGLSPVQIGVMMHNLMKRLGFNKYYIQAGDWGSQVASHMATLYQNDILGLHLNMPISSMPMSHLKILLGAVYPPMLGDAKYLDRIYPLKRFFKLLWRETGYFHIQATKPDTIGVALTDSPAGLAAYIIEKMAMCTNRDQLHTPHGGIKDLNLDDVLDTITIAWANNCIVTATRIYAEACDRERNPEIGVLQKIPTRVPTAAINFKYEVLYQPDSVIKDKYPNLVHSTTYDFGGHFAGLHNPKELSDDIFASTVEFVKFNVKETDHLNSKKIKQ